MNKLKTYLLKGVSSKSLGLFRLLFGLFMVAQMVYFIKVNFINNGFINPRIVFPFDYFEFLKPLPKEVFNNLVLVMLFLALMIAIGFMTRLASGLFGFFSLYILLLDRSYFNNHIYLYILVAFMLAFIESSQSMSVGSIFTNNSKKWIPNWQLLILKLHFFIVYFYGGLAKLNPDWLFRCEPIRTTSLAIPQGVWYSFMQSDFGIFFFSYGGLTFDLIIGFLLFHRQLKWIALCFIFLFNLMNHNIFNDIGIFPYLMIASVVLFFDETDIVFFKNKLSKNQSVAVNEKKIVSNPTLAAPSKPIIVLWATYLAFQLLFPFRFFFLPNAVDWSNMAQPFSWRMKIQNREVNSIEFFLEDKSMPNSPVVAVPYQTLINEGQYQMMAQDARMPVLFAKYIAREALKKGLKNPCITAKIKVSYNGRLPQYTVNPDVDLSKVNYSIFQKADWIMPLN